MHTPTNDPSNKSILSKNMLSRVAVLYFLAVVIAATVAWFQHRGQYAVPERVDVQEHVQQKLDRLVESGEQVFIREGLRTDTTKASIPLEQVLDGGPGKDGIPSLENPSYVVAEAVIGTGFLPDDMQGVVVSSGASAVFYPYSIMNRHEIVNDIIDARPVVITYCPLCGSAIVFDRQLPDGETVQFHVSGKLYNSNLLMYDDLTETLWSQAQGKGVVGDYTDVKLTRIPSQVMSVTQFLENYPDGKVLSDATGYDRDYTIAPYGTYDENDVLYFPVTNQDTTLPKKEILFVVEDGDESIAFHKADLIAQGSAVLALDDGRQYTASFGDGIVTVTNDEGVVLPGHHEMWFSWVAHNPKAKQIRFLARE